MSGRVGLGNVLLAILGVAFLASLAMLVVRSRQLARYRQERASERQSLRDLQQSLRQHSLKKPAAAAESKAFADQQAALAQRDATIRHLNRELSAASAEIEQLQAELASSSSESQKALASVTERDLKAQQNLKSQLTLLQRQVSSLEADSQTSRLRISALEADNARLRRGRSSGAARAAKVDRVMARLQNLNLRRDTYLNSIAHRYRDITSQFRAMSGMLASGQTPNSDAFSGAALLRIQNALASTDDDLRQLSDLNAQARRLEMELRSR
jgi:predicted RNase H-like nuclease (RuvC/YqgF family)